MNESKGIDIPTMHWSKKPKGVVEKEKRYEEEREKYAKIVEDEWLVKKGERMKGRKILEEMMYDFENQKEIRRMIEKKEKKWYEESYKKGYINYEYKKIREKYLKERRESIKKRYKIMKRIRSVVKKYGPMRRVFVPGVKRLVIDYHGYKNPMEGLISSIMVMNWYNESYEIYQYSPISGTGYKYYSGEKIIIYLIDEKMTDYQIKQISKAANQKKANGYDIEKCWKVIITLKKWNGCKDWTHMKGIDSIHYTKLDPRKEALFLWKCCNNLNDLIINHDHLRWCKKQGLDPWPYHWKSDVKSYFITSLDK